ncbi:MAG: hypothetical protein Ct9H90mP16_21570 [Candidatus Poseidoniales archaeon]|nr:MAG: hypothetical protein Ct9H90mP16_21570 [Candidatus Poseidoniales archaeon]
MNQRILMMMMIRFQIWADNCPFSVAGWFSTGASDYDRDGCHDLTNDPDDDNDGALDINDDCPKGGDRLGADQETDFDMDGCRDFDEDGDDDADMVPDMDDWCNRTIIGSVVNEFGCAAYEWDEDGDGIMDDSDQCAGTPTGLEVNALGFADLDSEGSLPTLTSVRTPINIHVGPSTLMAATFCKSHLIGTLGPILQNDFGTVGDFTVQTKSGEIWVMPRDWDGESTYLFIFNQDSSSYMSSLWSQNVGRLLNQVPENGHVFFGSFDSDYRSDIDAMNARLTHIETDSAKRTKLG